MMRGITDEERKAFMTQILPEKTADIKGEDDRALSKCVLTKRGGKSFLLNGLGIH